jgi:phosphoribosylanthranilate isomerase
VVDCKIKICGISNQSDLELIAKSGADFSGLLIEIESIRAHKVEEAISLCTNPPLPIVAVTLDRTLEQLLAIESALQPFAIQLHGSESVSTVEALKKSVNCELWKVVHLPAAETNQQVQLEPVLQTINQFIQAGIDKILIDATVIRNGERMLGGTGKTVDWQAAKTIRESIDIPFIVAGGINPSNVQDAVQIVKPYAVDLSSGVESVKGKKDPDKVLNLIAKVKACNEQIRGFMSNRVC